MKLKFKNIYFFTFIWVLFFIVGELIVRIIFKETTPVWKILSISAISAFGILIPYLKKGKEFDFSDITKYQKKKIILEKKIESSVFEQLLEVLKSNNYIIINYIIINEKEYEINFKTKISYHNFGEFYNIKIIKNKLILKSKPKFKLGLLDNGNARKNIKKILKLVDEIIIK